MSPPPFEALIVEHGRSVHDYLAASVGPHHGADCYQETMLAALRAYPDLSHQRNLRAWLFTIAHRKLIDHHRAAGRVVSAVETPDQAVDDPDPGDDALWAAVRALPPKQRAAVTLRYLADLSYAEIATTIDCREDAARQNVRAGLAALRKEQLT